MNQRWTISEHGTTRSLEGDPDSLRLRDVLAPVSGAQGGTMLAPRVSINGKEYREQDLGKSFSELNIPAGAVIEVST